jgi:hypothetical protein
MDVPNVTRREYQLVNTFALINAVSMRGSNAGSRLTSRTTASCPS